MKQQINAANAPAAIGPYCHAIEMEGFVFTSGQLGIDPATDLADFGKVNAIYAEFFGPNYPARSCVQVAALPAGGLVEIEAVANKAADEIASF